jgi:hypothetical protein
VREPLSDIDSLGNNLVDAGRACPPQESAKYDERCQQIAREVLFVFSEVQSFEAQSTQP